MVVEALPTLIHISVSLFFAGLAVFLWNVNLTIFKVVLSWIGVYTALYGCITLIPIFHRNSPYRSPLTPLVRPIIIVAIFVLVLLYVCFYLLASVFTTCFSCRRLLRIFGHPSDWIIQTLDTTESTPEKLALKISSAIDTRALMWTFDSLDEDHELDRFFSGLPGFHDSKVIKEPLRSLDDQQKLRLLKAVIRLLDRTFSSNSLQEQVKRRRANICANAIQLVDTPNAFPAIVRTLVSEDGYGPAQSTEIVDFVRRCGNRKCEDTTLVQAMFSIVVARVQRHDDSWFILASEELGIPKTVLQEYAAHGDSLPLAILIYITRQQYTLIRNPSWPSDKISGILKAASKFNALDTSPELQHEFCALWNQMVRDPDAWNMSCKVPENALGPIRNTFIALHQNTNSAPTILSPSTGDDDINLFRPSSYPLCNVSGHTHNGSTSATLAPIVPHDDPALAPAPLAGPVAPSFPLPEPFHVDESLTTVPPHDNSYSTRQSNENLHVPVTSPSPSPASAGAMRDPVFKERKRVTVTFTPQPASEISAISYPPSTPVPPVAVLQPNVIPLAPPVPQTSLDNSHPTDQTIKIFHTPINSPDQITPGAMRDTVNLGIATPLPTPDTFTSAMHPSTSLLESVSPQYNANVVAPPCPPSFPTSASSGPPLGNILHTGPSFCSHSPIAYLITFNSYRYSQRFSGADLYDCSECYPRE